MNRSTGKESKKYDQLVAQVKHKRGTRELAQRCLIVCEDNVSAVDYFEAVKKHLHVTTLSVQVMGSHGRTQPIQVVERALASRGKAADDDVPFSYIWCVVDGDYGDSVKTARAKAATSQHDGMSVQLIVTTQCFEHWVLLHFVHDDSPCENCDCVVSKLRKITAYTKSSFQFDEAMRGLEDACQRAKSKDQTRINSIKSLPENCTPCSEIYKIIETLRSIQRKESR